MAVAWREEVNKLAEETGFNPIDFSKGNDLEIGNDLFDLSNNIMTAFPPDVDYGSVFTWKAAAEETERRRSEAQAKEDEHKQYEQEMYDWAAARPDSAPFYFSAPFMFLRTCDILILGYYTKSVVSDR